MVKCTFCGNSIEEGTGKMFVLKSGKVMHFCSRKCEKNMLKLERNPLHTRWSKRHQKSS